MTSYLVFGHAARAVLCTLSLHDALPIWREVAISLLDARAGSPPSAVELLRRFADDGEPAVLSELLREAERWAAELLESHLDRKSTRLNSSHTVNSYAVFCLKKKKNKIHT